LLIAKPRPIHFDRGCQCRYRLILAKNHQLEIPLEVHQSFRIGNRDFFRWDTGDLGNDGFDIADTDGLLPLGKRLKLDMGTGLIDHVDRLVRQMPIIDVFLGQFCRRAQCGNGVLNTVVILKPLLQPFENIEGLFHRRLSHIDFLKTSRQGPVFLEYSPEFLIGG